MEEILSALMELIVDGSEEIVGSGKVHTVLRILAGLVLALFYCGCIAVSGVLAVLGFRDGNIPICLLGLGCLGFFAYGGYRLLRKLRKQ